jgi:L-malate glycosyltransferase
MTPTRDVPRLLFISATSEWTGPANSLLLLVRHLAPSFDVEVVMPGAGAFTDRLAEENVRTHTLPSLDKMAILPLTRLMPPFDLVYGNETSGAARNALIAAKIRRLPFICHLRSMGRPGDWRGRGFLRFVDAAVAVSQACARSHEGYVGRRRMHVVHNGIDLRDFASGDASGAREHLRSEAAIPSDAFVLISVGHLNPRKAQQDLVRSLARIVAGDPAAHLVVVGHVDRDEEYARETLALARELGVADHLRILGFRDDVPRLLRGADLYLHTALADPHPRSVIEAMAAGLAVVAYAVDGVAETVVEGETGHLVPAEATADLANATLRLIRDPARRALLAGSGRHRALQDFTAETTARAVGEIIKRTLAGARRSRSRRPAEAQPETVRPGTT